MYLLTLFNPYVTLDYAALPLCRALSTVWLCGKFGKLVISWTLYLQYAYGHIFRGSKQTNIERLIL